MMLIGSMRVVPYESTVSPLKSVHQPVGLYAVLHE
jgi:hypothetical protein